MKQCNFLLFWILLVPVAAFGGHPIVSVNSDWLFKKGDPVGAELGGHDVSSWERISLPHTWNDEDVYDEADGYYQGTGWYRKDLHIDQSYTGQRVFLKFEGANQVASVYINGKKAGVHKGGYTAFVVDITDHIKTGNTNLLAVKLTNRKDADVPPLAADFTFYGGIYRDVYLIAKDEAFFDLTDGSTKGIYISTPELDSNEASVQIKCNVGFSTTNQDRYTLSHEILNASGQVVGTVSSGIKGQSGRIESVQHLTVKSPELWSPDRPYLYRVVSELEDKRSGKLLDRQVNPLGMRWFSYDGSKGFFLNGKPLKLVGANRHQDHEGLGNALPDEIHENDVRLLKEMGANFIRISHYPQDPALLEACDKYGVLAWEEIPIVNYITLSDAFSTHAKEMQREMIRQHYNHPAIVMWGYMNEVLIKTPDAAKGHDINKRDYIRQVAELARELNALTRSEDPGRLTAIAHHKNVELYEEAGLHDITDVIGYNLYFGWYSEDNESYDNLRKFLNGLHEMHPDKLIIISEYGAGSDPRIHSIPPVRFDFSIEWQQLLNAGYLNQILNTPHVGGGVLWNFVDFNSEGRKDAVPHINSKGILNHDRRPKDIYYYYQAVLNPDPVLHIASTDWQYRCGYADPESGKAIQPVWIYTNQDRVELFVDNRSLGEKPVTGGKVVFDVPFSDGENQLKAVSGALVDVLKVQFNLLPEDLSKAEDIAINVNIGAHFYFSDPVRKEVWEPEKAYEKGSHGFIGGDKLMTWNGFRVGSDREIFNTTRDPLYQTMREGLTDYQFDVPKGYYELELHFAELYTKEALEKIIYNLNNGEDSLAYSARDFNVELNGEPFLTDITLHERHGSFRAVIRKTYVWVGDEGITLDFTAKSGKTAINAIALRKVY